MIAIKSIIIHCDEKFNLPSQVEAFRVELKKRLNLRSDMEIRFCLEGSINFKKFMKWRKNILKKKHSATLRM